MAEPGPMLAAAKAQAAADKPGEDPEKKDGSDDEDDEDHAKFLERRVPRSLHTEWPATHTSLCTWQRHQGRVEDHRGRALLPEEEGRRDAQGGVRAGAHQG